MQKHWYVVLLSMFLASAVVADDWLPLYEHVDPQLQRSLEKRIAENPEWARLVGRKHLAIGIVDLNGGTPRFARINGNQMMYAASLPKIAILLAAYVSFEDKKPVVYVQSLKAGDRRSRSSSMAIKGGRSSCTVRQSISRLMSK